MAKHSVFLTGFPGFIARRLVREMLARAPGSDFTFLVVDSFAGQARRETESLRTLPEAKGSRLDVVVGDITRPRLGLDESAWRETLGRITDVFHLAAIYDLHVHEDVAARVNVDGTRNVLELCRGAKALRSFVHFSTCYVAGRRTGTILEDELIPGAGFKNHYESTKFESERLVREAMGAIPTIIIRPGITVGDSKTGETQKFDGPYFGMVLIDKLKLLQLPLPYLGESAAEVNLVPIDYVAGGTAALWAKNGTTGKCYAMADPHPVTARTLYAELVRLVGARGPWGQIPAELLDAPLRLLAVRKLLGVPREVLDYFNHDAHFDTCNAVAALEGTGVSCPYLLDYLPTLVAFFLANKHRPEYLWKPF
ncbi:MAG: SDR family oxidoreductase [Deltaproteobacteria bacterium]|nr:SDR family oxidoreductase [Deltaproteobacteria bacterium]